MVFSRIDFNMLNNVTNPNSIHGIYPYRGKISAKDAENIISKLPNTGNFLDPFCGSGTIVYEAEKSVLKHGSYFTQNKSIAIGGSSFSIYHAWILKQAGVEKIILALDNDWDDEGNKDYGLKKMIKEGYKIKEMGFDVELIYDWNGEYLDNKDAPIDKGRQIYSKLYRERKNIIEFANEATTKEDNGEIPVTQ